MRKADIIQVFPITTQVLPEYPRRRLWLYPGVPVIIDERGAVLTLTVDREGEYEQMMVSITGRDRASEKLPLTPTTWMDMSVWAGLMMVPMACEYTQRGSISRVLVEFAIIGRSKFCVN
jgi:hypothetical protein